MKKNIRIIVINFGLTFAIIVAIVVIIKANAKTLTSRDVFCKIDFPEFAGEYNENIEIVDESSGYVKNNYALENFYTVDNELYKDILNKTIRYFDLNGTEKDGVIIEGNRNIKTYSGNAFLYSNNNGNLKEMSISSEKAVDVAKTIIDSIGIDMDNLEYYGIGYRQITDLANEKSTIIEKTVYFSRKINNIDVEGNSQIYISLTGNGEVSSLYMGMSSIEDTYSTEDLNVIPVSEAVSNIKQLEGYIETDESTDRVVIRNIEVVYWESAEPGSVNNTIQPVYKITGTAYSGNEIVGEFMAIESAIEE